MSYGNSSKYFDAIARVYNFYPGGSGFKEYSFANTFKSEGWIRSGTNTVRQDVPAPPVSFRKMLVPIDTKKRFSYKVVREKDRREYYTRNKKLRSVRLAKVQNSRKRGKRFLNPNRLLYQRVLTTQFGPSSITGRYNKDWYRVVEGPLWAPYVPFGSYVALGPDPSGYLNENNLSSLTLNAISKASSDGLSKFYEKVQNSAVNLAQALGERRQTASMLSDAVVNLAKAVKSLKQGNVKQALRRLVPQNSKELANTWLLVQYGVKPLLSDIDGAAKHLAMGEKVSFNVQVKKPVLVPRAKVHSESVSTDVKCTTDVYVDAEGSVSYKAKLRCNEPLLRDLSRLGFTDPLSLVWELLPYSFVADWFIPIGDYLANMDAFSSVELVYCTKTVFLKENTTFERRFGGRDDNGYTWDTAISGFTTQKIYCVREVLTTVPPLPVPSFKDPVSRDHLLNAIALLRQLKK